MRIFIMLATATMMCGTLADHQWHLPSGVNTLNGILLAGWTTAFLFAVFQHSWKSLVHADYVIELQASVRMVFGDNGGNPCKYS